MSDDGDDMKGCGLFIFLVCAGAALVTLASAWAHQIRTP